MPTSITNQSISLQYLLDTLHFGLIVIDREGSFLFSNREAQRLLGYPKETLHTLNFASINPIAWKEFQEIFRSGVTQYGKRKQYKHKVFFVHRWPFWQHGEIIAVVSVFQHYSEFEKNIFEVDSYKSLTKELNMIFQSTYDGLYITDGQGVTLRVNRSWEKITGLKPEDVLGQNTADLEKQGYISKFVSPMVIKEKKTISLKATTMTNREVLVSGNPVFDDQGNVEMVVTTVRDLTDIQSLSEELKTAQEQRKEYQNKLETLHQQLLQEEDLIAKSKSMKEIVRMAIQLGDVKTPILITGETGVGKEVVAKLIHKHNQYCAQGPFLKINCGAIPDNLLEAELFGYERGAFTNANPKGKPGLLELAEGGTLVLDEIGELSFNVQSKLLAVLQDSEITRVGGIKSRKIDVRFVFITNRDLEAMVKSGDFREDLYYRINIIPIHVGPLRERKEDIIPLINYFVQKFTKKYNKNIYFTREAIDTLYAYAWPGNVRELRHLIERFVVVHNNKEIDRSDIPINGPSDLIHNYFHPQTSLKQAVREFEVRFIKKSIETYGDLKTAADKLGVDQSTLYRKLKQA
ncbi:MAG: sigma 54-interacting transcriptional regulator [Desulfovermiculus sp.]|nr:sigma 54-interacting transcriptional regulator [Desulfovermiculus sp.]